MTAKAKENRTIKPVSFSHDDPFEDDLFAYAITASGGKFGPYIKRLIDRDRAGVSGIAAGNAPIMPAVSDAMTAQPSVKSSVGKTVAKAFL